MAPRKGSVLGTGLRYVVTVLVGTTLSMAIAYAAVRVLTRGTTFVGDTTTAEVQRGWDLRAAANELTRLANEFVDAVPTPATPLSDRAKTWLRSEYPNEMQALQTALSTEAMLDLAPARELLSACGRLRALALHPDDAGLRGSVLNEIKSALDGADNYLRERHLQGRIALPVTPFRSGG